MLIVKEGIKHFLIELEIKNRGLRHFPLLSISSTLPLISL